MNTLIVDRSRSIVIFSPWRGAPFRTLPHHRRLRLRLCCVDAGCVRTPLAHESSTLIYFESLIFQETTEELSILYMGFVRVRAYVANTTFNEL